MTDWCGALHDPFRIGLLQEGPPTYFRRQVVDALRSSIFYRETLLCPSGYPPVSTV